MKRKGTKRLSISSDTFTKKRYISNSGIIKEISVLKHHFLASQFSPQLNAEFGADYDASAERDEFHKVQIEQFAFQAGSPKEISTLRNLEKNSDEETIHTADW